jgi:Holliday junction resolvase
VGRREREKGARVEREIVNKLKEAGIDAKRVPLSGAAEGFKGDILIEGHEWRVEVKSRKGGAGFKVIQDWLGDNDVLVLKRNGVDPLVVLPFEHFVKLAK